MATRLWNADFDGGVLSQFGDTTQATWILDSLNVNHATTAPYSTTYGGPGSTTVQASIVRSGAYAAKIILKRGDTRERSNLNTEQRHLIQSIPGGGAGSNITGIEMWTSHSIYIDPANAAQQNLYGLQELHQVGDPVGGASGSGYGGPAPFNLAGSNDRWSIVLRGSTAPVTGFKQTVFGVSDRNDCSYQSWTPSYNLQQRVLNLVPFTKAVWHDWIFGWLLDGGETTGWFEAWHRFPAVASGYTQIIQRSYAPTWYNGYRGTFYANIYRQGYPALSDVNTITVYHDEIEIWNGPPDQLGTSTSAPAISVAPAAPTGTTQVGSVLTADTGSWTNLPTSYSYQWYRCDALGGSATAIAGQTASSHTCVSADVGSTLRCYVTATNAYGSSTPTPSSASGIVSAAPSDSFVLVQSKSATGTSTAPSATLDSTPTSGNLIVVLVGWNSTSISTAFTAGANISADLTSALNGESGTMRQRIYYGIAGASWPTVWAGTLSTSKQWVVHVLEFAGVSETSTLDKTAESTGTSATASSGTTAETTDARQLWLGFLVSRGVTAQSAPTNDFTQLLTATTGSDCVTGVYTKEVASTGTAEVGATVANSQWHGGIVTFKKAASLVPVNSSPPVVTGHTIQLETLTCSDGVWTNSPTITYQWQRDASGDLNFSNIGGATAATRVLDASDVDCNLRCIVTATNASAPGGVAATAAYVGVIAPAAPVTQTPPGVSGTPTIGEVLTSDAGAWLYLPTSYEYQWMRDLTGSVPYSDISGATSATYTITSDDQSCNIICEVTATNVTGSGVATSNPVGPVTAVASSGSRTQTARTVNPSGRVSGRTKSGTGGGL